MSTPTAGRSKDDTEPPPTRSLSRHPDPTASSSPTTINTTIPHTTMLPQSLSTQVSPSSLTSATQTPRTHSSHAKTIIYFMTIHFCIAVTDIITVAPLIALFERSLCLRYYGFDGAVGGRDCKVVEIQRDLARARGVKAGLDMIPVLLVTIPLGSLGNRLGRKTIMGIAIVGVLGSLIEVYIVCAFPKVFSLRLVWLSAIILLCGGGLNTATAFMYSMASEAFPASKRSQAYYYIFSAFYIAELIASFTAAMTIDISPWIPCAVALASMILCLALLVFKGSPSGSEKAKRLQAESSPEEESPLLKDTITSTTTDNKKPKSNSSQKALLGFLSNRNTLLTIPVFLVSVFRYTTLNILIQYASVRFGLKISTGAMFYTETAVANILLFLFALPRAIEYVKTTWKWEGQRVDLWIVRASLGFLCLGSLGIGLAQTEWFLPLGVLIFALGFGSSVSALSLISHWIPDSDKPTIYAAVVVLQSLGHALGDPTLMMTYSWGLGRGGWQAMPFFVVSGLYALAGLSACFIRLDEKKSLDLGGTEDVIRCDEDDV